MLIAFPLSAEYILRSSESNTKFGEFEYLQGGILYRFDFNQVDIQGMDGETTKMWRYKEMWLPDNITKDDLKAIIKEEKMESKATANNLKIWKEKMNKPLQKPKKRFR